MLILHLSIVHKLLLIKFVESLGFYLHKLMSFEKVNNVVFFLDSFSFAHLIAVGDIYNLMFNKYE
jgi:hypothetical protein